MINKMSCKIDVEARDLKYRKIADFEVSELNLNSETDKLSL